MRTAHLTRYALALTTLVLAGQGLSGQTHAGELSREHKADFSTVRLLNGGFKDGVWHAGVQLDMQPGWKTYWRVPGESGIPPQFDTSASTNAGQVQVHMPVPKRFYDENGEGIGYQGQVVFPVRFKPADGSSPTRLVMKFSYGMCKNICVPASSEVSLRLDDSTKSVSDAYRLTSISSKIPMPSGPDQPIAVKRVEAVRQAGKERLLVSLSGVDAAAIAGLDIFVEAPMFAYVRKPELVESAGTTATFVMGVDSLEADATLKGQTVRLTLAAPGASLVHEAVVD